MRTRRETRLKQALEAMTRVGTALASDGDVKPLLDDIVDITAELSQAAEAPDGADYADEIALLSNFAKLAASHLGANKAIRDERSVSQRLATLGHYAARAEIEMTDSVESLLEEIANSTGAAGAATSFVDENGEARLETSWGISSSLLAAWTAGTVPIPKGEHGFVVLDTGAGGGGSWSDLTVRVPRRGRETTLHIVYSGIASPTEGVLRLTAVAAIQLGALKDRTEFLSELRAAGDAERAAVLRLRALYEDIDEGIVVVDANGQVTFASRRACRILQRSPHELLGRGFLGVAEPDDRPQVVRAFQSACDGARVTGEFRAPIGASTRLVEFTARRDAEGSDLSSAVRLLFRDVTDERRRTAETLHREKLASVGQLAAGVAHEINNPISFVLSNYAFLARRLGDLTGALGLYRQLARTPEAARYAGPLARVEAALELDSLTEELPQILTDSLEGLERVRRIVGDMRVFARRDPDRPVPVDIGAIIDTALGMATPVAKMRARVIREIGASLPTVEAWPGRLTQCLLNLVVNAAQAIPPGAVDANTITVRAWSDDAGVSISIADTGAGILPEDRAKLFTPFFTTKSPGEGTGLGLALAWDTVRRHGGRIAVDSVVGRGTTFTIFLPFGGIALAPENDPSASLASEGLRLVS